MKSSMSVLAFLFAVFTAVAAEGPADGMTWRDANRSSAALVKSAGPSTEAADFARRAFDLYPRQSTKYSPENHAQLLMNLVGVRNRADGQKAALKELDLGIAAITGRAEVPPLVLVALWQEGARIAGRGTSTAAPYSQKALDLAEGALGEDHPRTIAILIEAIFDARKKEGKTWAYDQYAIARKRAAKAGEDSPLVLEIDLWIARLEMERNNRSAAIDRYKSLVDRLERRADPSSNRLLQVAYAQLEFALEQKRDKAGAQEVRQRRAKLRLAEDEPVVALLRVTPQYPRSALRSGHEGYVELHVVVNADGTVKTATVISSSPEMVFDAAAIQAVQKWKFRPHVVDGQPVETEGFQRIDFRLGE